MFTGRVSPEPVFIKKDRSAKMEPEPDISTSPVDPSEPELVPIRAVPNPPVTVPEPARTRTEDFFEMAQREFVAYLGNFEAGSQSVC